jgi:hypothetical protein
MVETGIWDRIIRRVGAPYDPMVQAQCELALQQLQNLERAIAQAVLRGENCITLWPSQE